MIFIPLHKNIQVWMKQRGQKSSTFGSWPYLDPFALCAGEAADQKIKWPHWSFTIWLFKFPWHFQIALNLQYNSLVALILAKEHDCKIVRKWMSHLLVDEVNLTNQARNWTLACSQWQMYQLQGVSKRRGGGTKSRDEGPCFILYFPCIHFTYTYRKLVFDTHAWIGM